MINTGELVALMSVVDEWWIVERTWVAASGYVCISAG